MKNYFSFDRVPVLSAPLSLAGEVFSSVCKNGGRILSFSFERDICSFLLTGCSAESVAQSKFCVVSCSNSKTQFMLFAPSLQRSLKDEENSFYESYLQNAGEDLRRIKEELSKLNAEIQSENITEKTIGLSFWVSEDVLYSALKVCGTEIVKLGWKEKSFSVEKNGRDCLVKSIFTCGTGKILSSDCSPMLLAASYAWLFKAGELAPSSLVSKSNLLQQIQKMQRTNINAGFLYLKNAGSENKENL